MANEPARRFRRSMTPQEVKLWVHLRELRRLGHHFRRQSPREGYVLDFVCLKSRLIIEVDGSQHGMPRQVVHDAKRDGRLGKYRGRYGGLKVLRFWNTDVDGDLNAVMDTIVAALDAAASPPTALRAVPPPRSGEG